MKNIRIFYLKIFIFFVIKFSVYLNRHVFVMWTGLVQPRWPRCTSAHTFAKLTTHSWAEVKGLRWHNTVERWGGENTEERFHDQSPWKVWDQAGIRICDPRPRGYKTVFHTQQLSVKFHLVIKIKIPTIKTFFMLNSAELSMKKVL